MTPADIKLALAQLDEVTLLEVLNLHSDEIVERFADVIEAKFDELQFKVEDPRESEDTGEENYLPLTGVLSWKSQDQETLDYDNPDE